MSADLSVAGSSALEGVVVEATPESTAAAKVRVAQVEAMQVISGPVLVIKDADGYAAAGAKFRGIKERITALEAERTAITKPINDGLRRINDLFKGAAEQLTRALGLVETPMRSYVQEQDRIRIAAEAVARAAAAEALEKLEAERAIAAAELEKAQAASQAAARALQAETNPFLIAAREAQSATAAVAVRAAAEASVDSTREQQRIESSIQSAAVPMVRAAGTKVMRPWKFEITDPALLPREFLIPNEQLIRATVSSLKGAAKIAGVRIFQDISIGGR